MSGGTVVDVLLVLVLVGYALSGMRRGLLVAALSLLGFIGGGVAGVLLLPRLVDRISGGDASGEGEQVGGLDLGRLNLGEGIARLVVLVLGVLLLAWVGQLVGSFVGRRLRGQVTWQPARVLDGALGAVAALLVVVLLTWFVAGALRSGPTPALSRAVGESRVVRVIDTVVPAQAARLAGGFRQLIEAGGFPRVFDKLGPELILPVDPPDQAEVAGVAGAAAASVVKVTGVAESCDRGQEGSGFVVAPQRVVTNAHVVAGVDRPFVQVNGEGKRLPGEVVVFEPDRDLAVLAVPGLDAAALPLGRDLQRGDPAVVAGYPLDGPFSSGPARVRQVLTARGEDIYGQPGVDRQVYSLFATVEPGNSGGPLLDAAGQVVGVVFAKSLDDASTGYALTLAESAPVLDRAAGASRPVDVGGCAG